MENEIKLITAKGRTIAPITLFAHFKSGRKKTVRGDKYTQEPNKMIILLFRHAEKILKQCGTIIVYDNRKSSVGGENIILKWNHGTLETNNTFQYGFENIHSFALNPNRV